VLDGHPDNFVHLALSGDEKTLASGGQTGVVYLWDVSSFAAPGTATPTEPETPHAPQPAALPRYKIASHATRGNTLTAKTWIDTPGDRLPTDVQAGEIWRRLSAKTTKQLVLHFYAPGMKVSQPPWLIASASEDGSFAIRRVDSRAPAKYERPTPPRVAKDSAAAPGGHNEPQRKPPSAAPSNEPNDPRRIAELKAVGMTVYNRAGRVEVVLVPEKAATDENLARLKDLRNISTLSITGAGVTDAGLEHLAGLTTLQSLNIYDASATGSGLAHLRNITGLKRLELVRTKLTDEGAANLRWFPNLDTLKLSNSNITSAAVESITGMSKLRELWINRTQVDDAALKSLAELGSLEMLRMESTRVTGSGLADLKRLPKLIELDLNSCPIEAEHLKRLHEFNQLQRLHLLEVKASQETWIALFQALPKCQIAKPP